MKEAVQDALLALSMIAVLLGLSLLLGAMTGCGFEGVRIDAEIRPHLLPPKPEPKPQPDQKPKPRVWPWSKH